VQTAIIFFLDGFVWFSLSCWSQLHFQVYFLFVCFSAPSNPQYCEGSSFGEVPNGQWMTQSFADQIPEFSAGMTQEREGSSA